MVTTEYKKKHTHTLLHMNVWEMLYVNDFWLLFPFRFVAFFSIVVVTGIVVVHVVVVSFILSLKMGNGWILDVLRLGFFIFCSVYFFCVLFVLTWAFWKATCKQQYSTTETTNHNNKKQPKSFGKVGWRSNQPTNQPAKRMK